MSDDADKAQPLIEREIETGLAEITAAIPKGESAKFCRDCGEKIPDARRRAVPGIKCCVFCSSQNESQ